MFAISLFVSVRCLVVIFVQTFNANCEIEKMSNLDLPYWGKGFDAMLHLAQLVTPPLIAANFWAPPILPFRFLPAAHQDLFLGKRAVAPNKPGLEDACEKGERGKVIPPTER